MERLNLAQAVAICLYELRSSSLSKEMTQDPRDLPASFQEQDAMFEHLRRALEDVHFLYGDKAESLFFALRHLLGRAQLSSMETKLLHGLARQVRWYVEHHPDTP